MLLVCLELSKPGRLLHLCVVDWFIKSVCYYALTNVGERSKCVRMSHNQSDALFWLPSDAQISFLEGHLKRKFFHFEQVSRYLSIFVWRQNDKNAFFRYAVTYITLA